MEIQPLFLGHHPGRCVQWSKHSLPIFQSPIVMSEQLLAYALSNMEGIGGYSGWRWIFIIEGLATVILAAVAKFFIVGWPETSRFLNVEERQLLLRRLSKDAEEAKMDHLDKKSRRRIFGDWKIYVGYAFIQPKNRGLCTDNFSIQYNHVPWCDQYWL